MDDRTIEEIESDILQAALAKAQKLVYRDEMLLLEGRYLSEVDRYNHMIKGLDKVINKIEERD